MDLDSRSYNSVRPDHRWPSALTSPGVTQPSVTTTNRELPPGALEFWIIVSWCGELPYTSLATCEFGRHQPSGQSRSDRARESLKFKLEQWLQRWRMAAMNKLLVCWWSGLRSKTLTIRADFFRLLTSPNSSTDHNCLPSKFRFNITFLLRITDLIQEFPFPALLCGHGTIQPRQTPRNEPINDNHLCSGSQTQAKFHLQQNAPPTTTTYWSLWRFLMKFVTAALARGTSTIDPSRPSWWLTLFVGTPWRKLLVVACLDGRNGREPINV